MRIREVDLILPALQVLADSEHLPLGVSTQDLARQLRARIVPTAEDLERLQGRKDDRLSQVIRNLVSHRTLERRGLATYSKNERDGRGYYKLTPMGLVTVSEPVDPSLILSTYKNTK